VRLRAGERTYELTRPWLMGVVNANDDSFSDAGRFSGLEAKVERARELLAAGADLIDIGGESGITNRPETAVQEEIDRVVPLISRVAGELGALVSVDTYKPAVAEAAVAAGARIVNDVSGGMADPDMLSAVAQTDADIVLQHWRGHSADMYARATYDDVVTEVLLELRGRVEAAAHAGIPPSRVVVDPGIGFGKQREQNWEMLRGLPRVVALGPRVLVGTSRKRFLAELLADDPADATEARRDLATAVTSALASQAGVWAVRVHDVAGTRDALAVAARWSGAPRRDDPGTQEG
jgi:dihydropteroate synthase